MLCNPNRGRRSHVWNERLNDRVVEFLECRRIFSVKRIKRQLRKRAEQYSNFKRLGQSQNNAIIHLKPSIATDAL